MIVLKALAYAFAGLLALLLIVPLPADFGFWVQEIRYRVTLEVDTPDGVKSGSSVIGVRRSDPPDVVGLGLGLRYLLTGGPLYPNRYYGDAPFVDLGGGRHAIMLLGKGFDWHSAPFEFLGIRRLAEGDMFGRGDPHYLHVMNEIWAGRILPPGKAEIATSAEFIEKSKALGIETLRDGPFVITFRDIKDTGTAAVLYTLDSSRSFAGLSDPRKAFEDVLGPGYAYKRATVEFVPPDTPVTTGIENRFPWWGSPVPWLTRNQGGTYADRRAPGSDFWDYQNLSTKDGFRRGSYGDRRYRRYDGNADYEDANQGCGDGAPDTGQRSGRRLDRVASCPR
jgi:hypothetical protein